jgi:two-component system cell cycle response regulator
MDGLKQINDTFGHQEGSQAIKRIAGILKETFRESDLVARLGGDEFAILVKDVNRGDAELINTHLEEGLRNYRSQGVERRNPLSPIRLTTRFRMQQS